MTLPPPVHAPAGAAVPSPPPASVTRAVAAARLRVVIVNYRTPGLTLDCLDSLADEIVALPHAHVVVVEGGSGDGSADEIAKGVAERGYRGWVTLDVRATNAGFAGGNNAAIIPALAEDPPVDYVLLLNPDTVVRPGAITALLQFMEARPAVGLAGSRLEHHDGRVQNSAFRFPSVASNLENTLRFGPVSWLLRRRIVACPARDEPHRTDWLAGASLIVRREVFDKIGPLDDGYFMYFEETDFCLAAHHAGFEAWYVPESRVVHLVGASSGVTAKNDTARPAKRRPAYWFESRKRYFVKNHGRLVAALADAAWIVGFSLWRLRVRLTRRPDRDPEKLLGDFIRHSVFVKGFGTP
ncbi:MAG: glycosyltransferase family 2 protein [Planctomycetota bacterium]